MSHDTPPSPLVAAQREIRDEALSLPPVPAITDVAPVPDTALPQDHPQRLTYTLGEFVNVHNEAFVELAYRCLLKRAPDPNGLVDMLDRLAAGDSKVALLGDMRWSREGRGFGVHVAGLAWRYRFWRATRWPVVGGLIERLALLVELPQIARELRRLGQMQARQAESENLDALVAELKALRDEVANLRAALRDRDAP